MAEAIITFLRQVGFEARYGSRVVAVALTDVHGEGRALIIDRHSPGFDLRDAVVNAALLSRQDTDVAAARFAWDLRMQTRLTMAGIGRR